MYFLVILYEIYIISKVVDNLGKLLCTSRTNECYWHKIAISFLASGEFCRMLITFANSLDPDPPKCWARSGSKLFDT